jgi:hypothetical protein
MPSILRFRLKVPGFDQVRDFTAISQSYKFQGQLQVSAGGVLIEWGGTASVEQAGMLDVRDDKIKLPDEALEVPFHELHRAQLLGGWWRPRLELQARALAALSIVPSSEAGLVQFWYRRRDRQVATRVCNQISAGIAAAALGGSSSYPELEPSAEEAVTTPPEGSSSAM